MDLFIDKLAQKINSNEMIKGNQAAEAKEIRKLKEKVENYESLLQEMKLVNMKNLESAQKLSDIVDDTTKLMAATAKEEEPEDKADAAEADREMIRELFDKQSDTIHKENIKVYRNVQAAMGESLSEQTKSILDAQTAASKKSGTGFLKVMSVLILIAVLADIALKVLPMFGLL